MDSNTSNTSNDSEKCETYENNYKLLLLPVLVCLIQIGCGQLPEEGTTVYNVDFPRVDEVDTGNESGSGSGDELAPVTDLVAVAGTQQNTLSWTAASGEGILKQC